MQAPPPPLPEDLDHLRLLALFHRILGGVMALFSFLPLLYVVLGIAVLAIPSKPSPTQPPAAPPMPSAMPTEQQRPVVHRRSSDAPPAIVGAMLITIGGLGFAVALGVAICVFCAGGQLDKRTRYGYCFAIACIECLFTPLGTALGVFSLIVLTRPSVKAMFG